MSNVLVWVIWLAAAAACIGTGLKVVTATNPFSSALSLIGNLASLAVLYLLASGEFVAVAPTRRGRGGRGSSRRRR